MDKKRVGQIKEQFDLVIHSDETAKVEFWYARELMPLLGYERTEARGRLRESEKRLSQNIYERGVDDAGFGRIRSNGDQALFGGHTTMEMKARLGVKDNRPLADFLPTLTIAAKNLVVQAGKLPDGGKEEE